MGEALLDQAPRRPGASLSARAIAQDRFDSSRQGGGVLRRDEDARLAVLDEYRFR